MFILEHLLEQKEVQFLQIMVSTVYTRDSSGNQRVFLDGTQTGSTYTTARNDTEDKLWIGAIDGSEYFTGYQSDIRITKGLARYTANFTPPTAALKG